MTTGVRTHDSEAPPGASIDLTGPNVTTVRVERGTDPLAGLDHEQRMRLLVRVLCELVAYGELDTAAV